MDSINERKLTKSERDQVEKIINGMKGRKRELIRRYGKDAEKVMYGRAAKMAKLSTNTRMKDLNLQELIQDALQNPKKADLNKDGKLSDYEKKRGAAIEKSTKDKSIKEYDSLEDEAKKYYLYLLKIGKIDKLPDNPKEAFLDQMTKDQIEKDAKKDRFERGLEEDLDLGHEDNEPHALKADLYRIGKYAMELYKMVDQFEYKGEVDFPSWWQSKIFKSKEALVSAKHYLDFELKEPQIDAMVDAATDMEAIDENEEYRVEKQADGFVIMKGNEVVKGPFEYKIQSIMRKNNLNDPNYYKGMDVKGEEPSKPDYDTDVDKGQPFGLAEKLAKHLKK